MKRMKAPCVDCLCVPVCKHKLFTYLIEECSIVTKAMWPNVLPHARPPYVRNMEEHLAEMINQVSLTLEGAPWNYDVDYENRHDQRPEVRVFEKLDQHIWRTIKASELCVRHPKGSYS